MKRGPMGFGFLVSSLEFCKQNLLNKAHAWPPFNLGIRSWRSKWLSVNMLFSGFGFGTYGWIGCYFRSFIDLLWACFRRNKGRSRGNRGHSTLQYSPIKLGQTSGSFISVIFKLKKSDSPSPFYPHASLVTSQRRIYFHHRDRRVLRRSCICCHWRT